MKRATIKSIRLNAFSAVAFSAGEMATLSPTKREGTWRLMNRKRKFLAGEYDYASAMLKLLRDPRRAEKMAVRYLPA